MIHSTLLAIGQVSASLREHGLLYIGDGKMGALHTGDAAGAGGLLSMSTGHQAGAR